MKILQVVPYFPPACAFGGPVGVAYQTVRELVKRKHEVVVYTSDAEDFDSRLRIDSDNVIDGVRVHYFRNLALLPIKKFKLFITPQLVSRAKEEIGKFDVIHLHEYRTFQNIVIAHYARKYGVPYVLQAHGSLPRIMAKQRLKWIYDVFFGYELLRDVSKVIALSPLEARQSRRMGVPEEKIAIIPNGIDLSSYNDLPPKGCFKERYGIEKGKKVILFLGRINRLKGIDFLIDAFAYMIKNMKYDALLVVAGPNDGYLNETKRLVRQHKIENRILFTGPLFGMRKVESYVDASIVASLDSLKEVVFLLVPLEAAACGTPVIVTKSNYIATFIKKGKFGSVVEYGNLPELTTTLKEMLGDESALNQMGLNGREFVFENFDWKNIIGEIEKVYESAVKRNR